MKKVLLEKKIWIWIFLIGWFRWHGHGQPIRIFQHSIKAKTWLNQSFIKIQTSIWRVFFSMYVSHFFSDKTLVLLNAGVMCIALAFYSTTTCTYHKVGTKPKMTISTVFLTPFQVEMGSISLHIYSSGQIIASI